jgi:AraC-like DNA-binding protein
MDINHFISDSMTYKYWENDYRVEVTPHNTGWRSLPFTAILCACDTDYICEMSGGETIILQKGMSVVIPTGIEHRMIMKKKGVISYIHILFSISGIVDIFSLIKTPLIIEGEMEQQIEACINLLKENDFAEDEPFPLKKIINQKEAAYQLAGLILSVSNINENSFRELKRILKIFPVLDYIQKNMSSISCRKELAEILRVSETRFHYIFKDATGQSPVAYLKDARLKKAQILLLTTELPIDSISRQVGYQDSFNFSKRFKMQIGTSPLVYRKNGAASFIVKTRDSM